MVVEFLKDSFGSLPGNLVVVFLKDSLGSLVEGSSREQLPDGEVVVVFLENSLGTLVECGY